MALREICPAVERGKVSRQHELSGCVHLIAEARFGRRAPPHDQVADVGNGRAADNDQTRLDQDLRSARRRPAVIGNPSGDGRGLARQRQRPGSRAGIRRRQLGTADAEEGRHQGKGEHGRSHRDGEGQARNGKRDGGGPDRWLRRQHHHRGRERDRKRNRDHQAWDLRERPQVHNVR